jgi:hypothetical protein
MVYEGRRFHLKLMPDTSPLNFPADQISWFCCDDTFINLEESVGFAFGKTKERAIANYFINLELAMDEQYKNCDEVLVAARKKRKINWAVE